MYCFDDEIMLILFLLGKKIVIVFNIPRLISFANTFIVSIVTRLVSSIGNFRLTTRESFRGGAGHRVSLTP